MKKRQSLVTKYLILILVSILMWPILPAIYYLPEILTKQHAIHEPRELELMWAKAGEKLAEADNMTIRRELISIQEHYPEAELFWVDSEGKTHMLDKFISDLPEQWTSASLIRYLDLKTSQDLLTVTAALGQGNREGMIIFHIPNSATTNILNPADGELYLNFIIIVTALVIIAASLLFFLRIRKRLVRLRIAMAHTGKNGLPEEVSVSNNDEIGQLERAFNGMVSKLHSSRAREKEEENLRKTWIANLSHDLRTPLTVIQQHAYTIQGDPASPRARHSIQIMIHKLQDIGKLLENLLTFTLLTARKHPLRIEAVDMIEHVQQVAVEWYPVFEKEGIEVEINLPDEELFWDADPLWLHSILDNLLQNVIRYAGSGHYIGIGFAQRNGEMSLFVKDRGTGIVQDTKTKGAGIGLSIVSLMTDEMKIDWEVISNSQGTTHYLSQSVASLSENMPKA